MLKVLYLIEKKLDGSTWYRCVQLADMANKLKLAEVEFIDWHWPDKTLAKFIDAADVFVIRPSEASIETLKLASRLKKQKPIIADIDDTFDDIDPLSAHYQYLGVKEVKLTDGRMLWEDGKTIDIQNNQNRVEAIKEVLRNVSAITTTTLELKLYADQFNTAVVIPNAINFDLFPPIKLQRDKAIRILWAGGASHYSDLAEIGPVLEQIMKENLLVEFHIAGTTFDGITKHLPMNRVKTYSWLGPDAHGFRLATIGADIGICPIRNTEFNTLKSSIKFYEYSSLKVPTVARNMAPYANDIVDGQSGLLYSNNKELKEKLEALIADPLERSRLAENAYDYVKRKRDVKDITHDWVKFLEDMANVYKKN